MEYPTKLEVILTQACIDLHNSQSSTDVDLVINNLKYFEQSNFALPEWLMAWIDITKKNPHLTAEEYYKRPKINSFPGFTESCDKSFAEMQAYEINQLKKLDIAVKMAKCDREPALRNCAYMIASRMLENSFGSDCEFGGELGFEWHCGLDFDDSLYNPNNFKLMVKILLRETAFWHSDVKSSTKKEVKLQPMRWL